jgi:hypothetical protein
VDKIIYTEQARYTITSTGEVFTESLLKTPLGTKGREWSGEFKVTLKPKRELTYRVNNRGYNTVRLASKTKMVHRLVAEAFIPNIDSKPFVNHKDGNKLNNLVSNLEWCTHQENQAHAWATGLMNTEGRANSTKALLDNRIFHKLPDEVVAFIRANFKKRCPINGAQAMSERFGVSATTISYVVNRKKAYA